jgi:hypothetical protein
VGISYIYFITKKKRMKTEKVKKATTTVNELFEWYIGTTDWKDDWQITNTMLVDGVHAQKGDYYGKKAVAHLSKNENSVVEVSGEVDSFDRIWELTFTLDGKEYEMSATSFFGEW